MTLATVAELLRTVAELVETDGRAAATSFRRLAEALDRQHRAELEPESPPGRSRAA